MLMRFMGKAIKIFLQIRCKNFRNRNKIFTRCQEKILDTSFFVRYYSKGVMKKGGFYVEKIVEQGLLYDFYGELLTEHQRQIYESCVFDNLSLGEIAQDFGISRQGVHDLIKRCDKALQGYEEKHLGGPQNGTAGRKERN